MPQPRGSAARAGKRDVELAKQRVDLAKVRRSHEVWTTLARGLAIGIWIAATAIPLLALRSVIEPLAGKETVVNANVVISITVAISVAINVAQAVKGQSQKAELKRQREQIDSLEARLLE